MSRHIESRLQISCVQWFKMQYSDLAPMLFAVPNGGARSAVEAKILKAEGVTAGVADLVLLVGRGGYSALCIEMKTTSSASRQSPSQQQWQAHAEHHGNKYIICRSVEQFILELTEYLNQ